MGGLFAVSGWIMPGLLGMVAVAAVITIIQWMRRPDKKAIQNATNGLSEPTNTMTDTTDSQTGGTLEMTNRMTRNEHAGARPHGRGGFWLWSFISLLVLGALGWLIWNSSIATGFGAFKWILWSLLGIGGLLAIVGISTMTRRHPLVDEKRGSPRGLGFLTLISGLILGLASWFVWQPKIDSFSGMQDQISKFGDRENEMKTQTKGLASKLISRDTIIRRLTGNVKDYEVEIAGLRKDNEDELKFKNGVIEGYQSEATSMKAENIRLKGLIGNNDNSARSDDAEAGRLNAIIAGLKKGTANTNTENTRVRGLLGAYRNDSEVQSAKIAALEAENTTLRNRPAPRRVTRSLTPTRRDSPLSLINQHNVNNGNLRLAAKDYTITKMRQTNLVRGKSGHYYRVVIKNAANGRGYKFASASYSKVEPEAQFMQSLTKAIGDIKRSLDGRRDFQIYVRGNASAGKYIGSVAPGYEYNDIMVLEQFRGRYDEELEEYVYGPRVTNKDLPNLRGAYLQELISKNYKVKKPIILNGKVSQSKDSSKQAVAIILYVED